MILKWSFIQFGKQTKNIHVTLQLYLLGEQATSYHPIYSCTINITPLPIHQFRNWQVVWLTCMCMATKKWSTWTNTVLHWILQYPKWLPWTLQINPWIQGGHWFTLRDIWYGLWRWIKINSTLMRTQINGFLTLNKFLIYFKTYINKPYSPKNLN